MRKLGPEAITAEQLREFVENSSDFAFEMEVLSCLRRSDCSCSHSGTYEDPIKGKLRQYDLRADKIDGAHRLALAVECKNLRPNFPLLISAVPRNESEVFHEVVECRKVSSFSHHIAYHVDHKSIYLVDDFVGKQTDQVGMTQNAFFSDDAETFDKIAQSISSSNEVFIKSAMDFKMAQHCVVLPIVVVPTRTLWQVNYNRDGEVISQPNQVQEATLFIDHMMSHAHVGRTRVGYRISHLHIVTIDFLERALKRWMGPVGFFQSL